MVKIIYSRKYNIGFYGLERLHPFDSKKYGRAWRYLRAKLGRRLKQLAIKTDRSANLEELLFIHDFEYLKQLRSSRYVAAALELPPVAWLPGWVVDLHILRPMRWATRGTIVAAESALKCGLAINLSGGYHHAKPGNGEGFSIYADAAIAVQSLRKKALIENDSRIVYVDTDAHQGNGFCHAFMHDRHAYVFDVFNSKIYPAMDIKARERIDCPVKINSSTTDLEYLGAIENLLPGFLNSVTRQPVGLAIYNAGTDVYAGDPVGCLNLSAATILKRDLMVVSELRKRNIPTVMVLSGGYTRESYQLVADSVLGLVEQHAA